MLRKFIIEQYKSLHFQRALISSKAITYAEYGDPEKVLFMKEYDIGSVKDNEVIVQMLAAPVHPSDINTVQGLYPIKPQLPAVAGNEGVGKVVVCGSNVTDLKVGETVIPSTVSSGTWQTHIRGRSTEFIPIGQNLPPEHAAVFTTNPSTAFRMLSDFGACRGDVVVQNGSTSAVGIYVIQIAKILGLKTINLFRERDNEEATEKTRRLLLDYGATWAVTEMEFLDAIKSTGTLSDVIRSGSIKLALSCLGGKPSVSLLKAMGREGSLVSYGGMTRNPMPVPVGPLIFKDIRLRGFWMSAWIQSHDAKERRDMLVQLAEWFALGLVRPSPYIPISFADWKQAVNHSIIRDSVPMSITKKAIFVM